MSASFTAVLASNLGYITISLSDENTDIIQDPVVESQKPKETNMLKIMNVLIINNKFKFQQLPKKLILTLSNSIPETIEELLNMSVV